MKKLILAALLSLPFLTTARAEEGRMAAPDGMQQGNPMKAEEAMKPDASHAKAKKPAKKKSDAMKNDSMRQGDAMKHDEAMGEGKMGSGNP